MKLMLISRKSKVESKKSEQRGRLQRQDGITSIVVVFVLVTLLTLIGIGFTKIMNRSIQSSAASQQATAANYAAESGVNDVLSYLKTQPTATATKCDDLIKTGAPLAGAANLSGDGSTAYSCVLVDPNPTSLFYKDLDPYKSQIVKITTSTGLASLLFSWQSPNRQHYKSTPAGASQTLYDETTWSNKNYAPLLRVTLYPIPADGNLSGVQNAAKTFFLYPQIGGSNTLGYNASSDTSAVNCASKNIGSFSGTADFDCNFVINNLPNASYFYARFAPYYDQAIVKIKGNDASGQPVKFKNVQSVVDVTAKSGGATKRLQARLDISGTGFNVSPNSDSVPEFALGSADTICKRLRVQSPGSLVFPDPSIATNCAQIIVGPQKPTVNTTDATNKQQTTATLNGNVNPNGEATTYQFKYGTTTSYGSTTTTSSAGAGTSAINVSANITGLTQGKEYHFQLCATNIANSIDGSVTCGTDLTFTTSLPSPSFTFNADRTSIGYNESTTLRWTTSNVNWCWGTSSGGTWGTDWKNPAGGSDGTGTLTGPQNYIFTLQCGYRDATNDLKAPTQSVTVTVGANPLPPQPYLTSFVNEPEGSNSLGWSGGHLQYCHIWGTDKDGNNMETDPVDTRPDGGNITLGDGPPYNIWLQCRNQAGITEPMPLNQPRTPPPVDESDTTVHVEIGLPGSTKQPRPSEDAWANHDTDFIFGTIGDPGNLIENNCRDGYHNFVACFDIVAYQGASDSSANRAKINSCFIDDSGEGNSIWLRGEGGGQHWAGPAHWLFYTVGWNRANPSTGGEDPNFNFNKHIQVTCVGTGGPTGTNKVTSFVSNNVDYGGLNVHWTTCADRGQKGAYHTDELQNGCVPTGF